MASNRDKVIYELSCGHPSMGPATLVNGQLICFWHNDWFAIVDVIVWEWRFKCDTCNTGKWAGLSQSNANLFANRHHSRNPAHKPYAEYAKNPEAVKTKRKFDEWQGKKGSS